MHIGEDSDLKSAILGKPQWLEIGVVDIGSIAKSG
jgi:hypothetical protein